MHGAVSFDVFMHRNNAMTERSNGDKQLIDDIEHEEEEKKSTSSTADKSFLDHVNNVITTINGKIKQFNEGNKSQHLELSQQKPLNDVKIREYFKNQRLDLGQFKSIQREMFITEISEICDISTY